MKQGNCREQEYIDNLIERLGDDYISFQFHIYYSKGQIYGEIDVLALRRDGFYDVYEVKASEHGLSRARQQLHKAHCCVKNVKDTYAYIGLEDKIIKVEDEIHGQ